MNIILKIKKALYKWSKYGYTMMNKCCFKLNGIAYGEDLCTRGKVFIYRHSDQSQINIGNRVIINSAFWANPIGGCAKTAFQVFKNGQIIIGDDCGISNSVFASASRIVLGKRVMIGAGCKLFDTDFHAVSATYRGIGGEEQKYVATAPIIIEDDVFVGSGTLILKGVSIGARSVIGANSVVTHDIPAGEIWAGNPARFIKIVKEV